MITLLNRDERERIAAVEAVLRRCRAVRGRLLVIADESASDALERAVHAVGCCPPELVQFVRPVPGALSVEGSRFELYRGLRSLVLPFVGGPTPLVVWIECSLDARGLAACGGIAAYERGLSRHIEPLAAALISAHWASDVGQLMLGRRLGRRRVVVTGSALAARGAGPVRERDEEEAPTRVAAPMLSLAEILRAENLGDGNALIAGFLVELSDPLALVSSALQHLHDRPGADAPTQELITIAFLGAGRMQAMLQGMRGVAPTIPLVRRDADLNELVLAALRLAAEDCAARGIVPEAVLAEGPLRGRFDPARLMQVLLNLFLNAIESDPSSGGALRVHTRSGDGGQMAVLAVESGGAPIADSVVKSLFRPFFITRADDTGLGLHLSRQIIVAHGGSIHAESLDEGLRFTVVLPLRG